ncbi:MAG: lycopene beta-cyclase CrtY [Candidatus Makana argininalis]
MKSYFNIILIGLGLSNGLIAIRLKQHFPDLNILLIDKNLNINSNKTWSVYFNNKLLIKNNWLFPIIDYFWPKYIINFKKYRRLINKEYLTITSNKFYKFIKKNFKKKLIIQYVVSILSDHSLKLNNNVIINSDIIIDGRGYKKNKNKKCYFQYFFGQEFKIHNYDNIKNPIIMDDILNQKYGYRFLYILPISKYYILIEDTIYLKNFNLKIKIYNNNILKYLKKNKFYIKNIIREEKGIIPIYLYNNKNYYIKNIKIPCSGLRAGLLNNTTGYSFQYSVFLADKLSKINNFTSFNLNKLIIKISYIIWNKNIFLRVLNTIFLINNFTYKKKKIIQNFYTLSDNIINKFYLCKLHLLQKIKIIYINIKNLF